MGIKTSSKKYEHFEFGDGEDTPRGAEAVRNVNKKHQSQWDFEDFVTPEKTKPKILPGNQRSVGWSDDEVGSISSSRLQWSTSCSKSLHCVFVVFHV